MYQTSYYNGTPMGMNWMHMLALYSSMGKKSTTHEEKCEIGTQLQRLDGKDRMVIDGINDKINELINRNNVALSSKDMSELKRSIVSEMGKIASGLKNKHSSPVTCNADSLIFDKDVKKMLSDLVRDKSNVFNNQNVLNEEEVAKKVMDGIKDLKNEKVFNEEEVAQRVLVGVKGIHDDNQKETIPNIVNQIVYMNQMIPEYFNGRFYSKSLSEVSGYFTRHQGHKLLINTKYYVFESLENSKYVKNSGLYQWERTLGLETIFQLAKIHYNEDVKKIPSDVVNTIKSIVNAKFMNSSLETEVSYNDVELLRTVYTIIHEDKNKSLNKKDDNSQKKRTGWFV